MPFCWTRGVKAVETGDMLLPHSSLVTPVDPKATATTFQQWLSDAGLPAQKVTLSEAVPEGRGLVATSDIAGQEPLLKIPASLLLTAERAASDAHPALSAVRGLSEWSALALFLASHRARLDNGGGGGGSGGGSGAPAGAGAQRTSDAFDFWAPYVASLPRDTAGILAWSDDEVARLLGGSSVELDALSRRRNTERAIADILEKAGAAAVAEVGLTRENLAWAFSMVFSRLVRLASLNDTQALVPWADMINHVPGGRSYLDWSPEDKAVVLRPDGPVRSGQQLYGSYGERPSGDLLLSYGFVPGDASANDDDDDDVYDPKARRRGAAGKGGGGGGGALAAAAGRERNPHEAAGLVLGVSPQDRWAEAKAEALAARGIDIQQTFWVRSDSLPSDLLPFAEFASAGLDSADAVQREADRLFGQLKGGFLQSLGLKQPQVAPSGAPSAAAVEAVLDAVSESLVRLQSTSAAGKAAVAASAGKATGFGGKGKGAAASAAPAAAQQVGAARSESAAAAGGGAGDAAAKRRASAAAVVLAHEARILKRTEDVLRAKLAQLQGGAQRGAGAAAAAAAAAGDEGGAASTSSKKKKRK